ncbi:MAG: TonB family protein [Pyrinomonadaceae bacterium]
MLDQLVESKSNSAENTRKNGFLLTVFVLMATMMMSAWLYSLFAKDFGMGGDDLELSTLVAPVPVPDEEPPPEPEKQPDKQRDPNVDVRKEIIAAMDESPTKPPEVTSVVKQTIPPRDPTRYTVKGDTNYTAKNPLPSDYTGRVNTSGTGSDSGLPGGGGTSDAGGAPPPPPPPPKPTPKPAPKTVSGGVLNGKATNLPKPPYPAAARAVRASGAVTVQVLIDESGRVVSANATGGHPLLRNAAENAARGARFSPTMLSGQAVKVTGVITYNFVP